MSYVLAHEGVALVVDPQRDVERMVAVIETSGAELGLVLETHVHNDYVSGGRELAALFGVDLVLPAASGAGFTFRPAFHGEDLPLGDLSLRPLHTPGHTPEHTSYLVLVDGNPVALFSGGSLLVGSAGRTDLLGSALARQLARLQHGSVQRLAALPAAVGLYPTHGEGSFCTAGDAASHTSSIGDERAANPVLTFDDPESFADAQLADLQPYPSYYAHMGPLNRIGPVRPPLSVPELRVADIPPSASVVDVRPGEDFAAGHLPGSVGISASDSVAMWAGWVLPFDVDVVIVAGESQDISDIVVQFTRIGFDHVRGVVRNLGDRATASFRTVTVDEVAVAMDSDFPPLVVDCRAPSEWEAGHLPRSRHCYTPDVPTGLSDLEVWLGCGTGFRATIAAGLAEQLGLVPVVLTDKGIPEVLVAVAEG